MKKVIVLLTICLVISMATPAVADEEVNPQTINQLAPAEILTMNVVLAPVYFMWMTALHESSHALAVIASGNDVLEFKPYPHISSLSKRFVFGEVIYMGEGTPPQMALFSAAPMINDIALFTSADLLLTYADVKSPIARSFIFFGGMICPLVDFLTNLYGPNPESDYHSLVRLSGISPAFVSVAGNTLAFLAVWRVIRHSKNIFVNSNPPGKSSVHFTLMPVGNNFSLGLTVTGLF